ncbi:MAG TPA: HAD-IA family hydrolase [Thermoplasmata archaeon]|nr:HAD-IA family hydrolase [Thermoplasmata archaeon]
MKPVVVCFDLGGTLVDLRPMIEQVRSRILAATGCSRAEAADLAQSWALRTAESLPAAQGPRFRPEHEIAARSLREVLSSKRVELSEQEALREIRDAWAAFVAEAFVFRDVTASWWEAIHENSDGVALVSDIDKEAAEALLERLHLQAHFDTIILSEIERAYKPNPILYRRAADSLHVSPGDCLFVSDSTQDLLGAFEVGMGVALVRRELRVSRLPPPKGTLNLETLTSLPPILRRNRETGHLGK